MALRSKVLFPVFVFALALSISVSGQTNEKKEAEVKPTPTSEKKEAKVKATPTPAPPVLSAAATKDAIKNPTAEQLAETTIFIYGFGGGRVTLNQIRKTGIEHGKISVANADGKMEQATFERFISRGESMSKDKVRIDQEFPTAKYSLVLSDDKIFGIFDTRVFTPRDDASRAFLNQEVYCIDTLLRYKENESTLTLVGKDKIGGVDMRILDVTDKQNRKSRFYLSAKTFRVLMLDYEDQGIKYRRKFYDYNVAQGTLFPFRTALYADGKLVEETNTGTVTYGQKLEDSMFSES